VDKITFGWKSHLKECQWPSSLPFRRGNPQTRSHFLRERVHWKVSSTAQRYFPSPARSPARSRSQYKAYSFCCILKKSDRVAEGQPFIASLGWAVFGERTALSLSGGSGSVLPITPSYWDIWWTRSPPWLRALAFPLDLNELNYLFRHLYEARAWRKTEKVSLFFGDATKLSGAFV